MAQSVRRSARDRISRMRTVCVSFALALATPAVSAQVRSGEPHAFLRTQIGFTDDQIAAIDDDRVVTKVIMTGESREVAIAGVVRIRATTSFFLRMFRDIERFDTAVPLCPPTHPVVAILSVRTRSCQGCETAAPPRRSRGGTPEPR